MDALDRASDSDTESDSEEGTTDAAEDDGPKRPDVAARQAARKTTKETVIKSTLLKYVIGESDMKRQFVLAVQGRVESYSMRMVSASTALCGLIKEMFYGVADVTEVNPPDVCDVTVFRQLMLGVKGSERPDAHVAMYYERFPGTFKDPARHVGDRDIYSYGAQLYVTNLRNELWMNFEARLKKFLRRQQDLHEWSDILFVETLYGVMGWDAKKIIRERETAGTDTVEQLREAHDVVREIRRILGTAGASKVADKWLKSAMSVPHVLRLYVHFNRFYSVHRLSVFNLVPVCKIRSHFITIDWTVLVGILNETGVLSKQTAESLEPLRDDIWRSVLDVERLTKGRDVEHPPVRPKTFTGTVQTDGTSLCTHFKRLKDVPIADAPDGCEASTVGLAIDVNMLMKGAESRDPDTSDATFLPMSRSTEGMLVMIEDGVITVLHEALDVEVEVANPDSHRVIAVDPGNGNIFTVIEVYYDVTGRRCIKVFKLTRGRYYRDSGMDDAQEATAMWSRSIRSSLDALSLVSTKGVDVHEHDAYVKTLGRHSSTLWSEYTKGRWARQRLALYGGKKRSFARFFNDIEAFARERGDLRPVKLLYGSAKFSSNVHGKAPTPMTGAFRAMSERFRDWRAICEYRTTRVHAETDTLLKGMGVRQLHEPRQLEEWKAFKRRKLGEKDSWKAKTVLRGLLWCGSTIDKRGKFVDRDVNAAINI